MISRDLTLRINNNTASLSEPVTVYMYDRGILLNITVLEYKYKINAVEQENVVEKENIVFASALIRSPKGKVFKYPDIKADITKDNIVRVLITKDWTSEVDECGKYQVQIQLYDIDNSRVSLPPFSFTVSELIAPYDDGVGGDISSSADIAEFNTAYIGLDVDVHDDSNITRGYYDKTDWVKGMNMSTGHFNKIENRLEEIYSGDGLTKTNISELNTDDKTTIGAINELVKMYQDMQIKIDNLIKGVVTPDIFNINILNSSPLEKQMGESFKIEYEVTPYDANKYDVSFSSNNENVCTVSKTGLVKVMGVGNCTITCYSNKDSNICDTLEVNCVVEQVGIESIDIGLPEIMFDPREGTHQLNCIISPEDCTQVEVTWSSSNENVCTVDSNGVITKVLNGDNLIGSEFNHMTFDDSIIAASNIICRSDSNYSVYDYCRILFGQVPTEITISGDIPTDLEVGDIFQLYADLSPDNIYPGYDGIEWCCDSDIASVDENGLVTILGEGLFDIYAKSIYNPDVPSNVITVRSGNVYLENIELYTEGYTLDSKGNIYVPAGDTVQFKCKLLPSNTTQTNVKIKILSPEHTDNTIDENGLLTTGTSTGALSGTCMVQAYSEDNPDKVSNIVYVQRIFTNAD